MSVLNGKDAYYQGCIHLENKNFIAAEQFFQMAKEDSKYHDVALSKLYETFEKMSDYSSARKHILENQNLAFIKEHMASLDLYEYNFDSSKKWIYQGMNELDRKTQLHFLSLLALLMMQLGNFSVAEKMYESMSSEEQWNISSNYSLIYLYLIQHNYEKARELYCALDSQKEQIPVKYKHGQLGVVISYLLGELNSSMINIKNNHNYVLNLLLHNGEEREKILINHIKRHNVNANPSQYFFDSLDFQDVLSEVRDKMKEYNENYAAICSFYKLRLDHPIGICRGKETCDISVSVIAGTDEIITAYPMRISSEYDKEGYATNEKLKVKRMQGVRYHG